MQTMSGVRNMFPNVKLRNDLYGCHVLVIERTTQA